MVMEISINKHVDIPFDNNSRYYSYTVHANHHRILTIATTSSQTLSKWLNDFLKSTATTTNNNHMLVAVSAEHHTKRGVKDQPYDILTLCVGSHCLIYHLDTREDVQFSRDNAPNKSLRAFFENPRVLAVGIDMEAIARKMERVHGIVIKNAVDLRSMAVERLKEKGEPLDLARYDLDKLAVTVLGKHVDVVRPEKKVEWYDDDSIYHCWWFERELRLEKVQFATIDAYLCFLVGSELHSMIHGSGIENVIQAKSRKKNVKKEKENKN